MKKAIKEFDVDEGTTLKVWYLITVFWRGYVVETFLKPTKREARSAFKAAGYIEKGDG